MISIIIPTFNRASYLEQTLISFSNQVFPTNSFEILIIDNVSTDNTKGIAEKFIKQNRSISVKYFYEHVPGLLSGRHRGAKEAQGEILTFTDDDIIASSHWLQAIFDSFTDSNVHLVGGKCLPKYEKEPPYWTDYLWERTDDCKVCTYYSLIDQGDLFKEVDPNFVWGLNFSIRKKTLFELGGFHPDSLPKKCQFLQGDGETGLTMKLKAKGLKAIYNPRALVHHWVTAERMTFEYIERRMFFQGVCDSFTYVRDKYLNVAAPKKIVQDSEVNTHKALLLMERVFRRVTSRNIKDELRTIKNQIELLSKNIKDINLVKAELFERVRIAYKRGYEFHQQKVNSDSEILKWVLKKDYFDYDYRNLIKE